MVETRQRKLGCENCRARHLKCNGSIPCVNCIKKDWHCHRRSNIRFSHTCVKQSGRGQFQFIPSQKWANTQRKRLKFVDQTLETVRGYGNDECETQQSSGDEAHQDESDSLTQVRHSDEAPSSEEATAHDENVGDINTRIQDGSLQEIANHNIGEGIHPPKWDSGRTRRMEAELLRIFIEDLGPALDPRDSVRTFAIDIAECAMRAPAVRQSILVTTAKYLTKTGKSPGIFDEKFLNCWSQRIVANESEPNQTIPEMKIMSLLGRVQQNIEDNVFDSEDVFSTARIWTEASDTTQLDTVQLSFQCKTVWSALWQEVYLSAMHHHPFLPKLTPSLIGQHYTQNDDSIWTDRIFLHLVDTMRFCFSDDRSPATYDRHLSYLATWMESKPSSFTPVYIFERSEGPLFPEIWLLNDAVAAGVQFYHLNRALLLAHNPRMPRLGQARRRASAETNKLIREDVKTICGIAESMEDVHPAHLVACMSVSLVGDRFTQREEQKTLLELLKKSTSKYGWSTSFAEQYLRDAWGWDA